MWAWILLCRITAEPLPQNQCRTIAAESVQNHLYYIYMLRSDVGMDSAVQNHCRTIAAESLQNHCRRITAEPLPQNQCRTIAAE